MSSWTAPDFFRSFSCGLSPPGLSQRTRCVCVAQRVDNYTHTAKFLLLPYIIPP